MLFKNTLFKSIYIFFTLFILFLSGYVYQNYIRNNDNYSFEAYNISNYTGFKETKTTNGYEYEYTILPEKEIDAITYVKNSKNFKDIKVSFFQDGIWSTATEFEYDDTNYNYYEVNEYGEQSMFKRLIRGETITVDLVEVTITDPKEKNNVTNKYLFKT